MTGCSFSCAGRDQRAFRVAMTRRVIVACAEHEAWLTSQGLTLVPIERRVAAVAVASDRRRRFVAPWRRNLTARDMTGVR